MTLAEFIEALNTKFKVVADHVGYTFEVEPGRKYNRVVQTMLVDGERSGQRSVYCFVDNNGYIYKADSWKKPAKGIRAGLSTLNMNHVDPHGSWLYRR